MTYVEYLDADTIIELNRLHCGPGAGVMDRGGVESAVARVWSGFGDAEFFQTLWDKAAVYLHGLSTTQHFLDGNKRTAWLACTTFLRLNHEDLAQIDADEGEAFVLAVAAGDVPVDEIGDWLCDHAVPLPEALEDEGVCDYCGVEGELPGAEYLPRAVMRRMIGGNTVMIQGWSNADGEFEGGVRPFSSGRDLIPGVCRRCSRGWMRLTDRRGMSVLLGAVDGDPPLSPTWRSDLSAWALKAALLRSALEPAVDPAWRTHWSTMLRQRGRVPRGWSVWMARREPDLFDLHVGRFTFAWMGTEDEFSEGDGRTSPNLVQHFTNFGPFALASVLIPSVLGDTELYPPDTMAQIWPSGSVATPDELPMLDEGHLERIAKSMYGALTGESPEM